MKQENVERTMKNHVDKILFVHSNKLPHRTYPNFPSYHIPYICDDSLGVKIPWKLIQTKQTMLQVEGFICEHTVFSTALLI